MCNHQKCNSLTLIHICKLISDVRLDGVPNKLNVNAPEFTINREQSNMQSFGIFSGNNQFLQHSKSSGNIQQQIQLAAARRHAVQMANMAGPRILVQHPLQMQLGLRVSGPQAPLNTINSANGQSNEVSDQYMYI